MNETVEDVTTWAEDDSPESFVGDDASDELDYEPNWGADADA